MSDIFKSFDCNNVDAPDIDENILHEIKKLVSSDKDVRKNAEIELGGIVNL
jgi:hypothetical protein